MSESDMGATLAVVRIETVRAHFLFSDSREWCINYEGVINIIEWIVVIFSTIYSQQLACNLHVLV
jgi:hypothetical protein